jgi:hypothetical protein
MALKLAIAPRDMRLAGCGLAIDTGSIHDSGYYATIWSNIWGISEQCRQKGLREGVQSRKSR